MKFGRSTPDKILIIILFFLVRNVDHDWTIDNFVIKNIKIILLNFKGSIFFDLHDI
jgi:hypothetical protein